MFLSLFVIITSVFRSTQQITRAVGASNFSNTVAVIVVTVVAVHSFTASILRMGESRKVGEEARW